MIDPLPGGKSYLAACGLLALAFYNYTQGDYASMCQNLMAAAAVFGLRQAIARGH